MVEGGGYFENKNGLRSKNFFFSTVVNVFWEDVAAVFLCVYKVCVCVCVWSVLWLILAETFRLIAFQFHCIV